MNLFTLGLIYNCVFLLTLEIDFNYVNYIPYCF